MKKLLVLLAVCALLVPCAAPAEGNYIRQLPQDPYTLTTLIAPECYPEVTLTTDSTYRRFGSSSNGACQYLSFPGPDGALANRIDYNLAHFLDVDNLIQYTYQLSSSDSYEEFINSASKDEYILLDGTGKTAAYIDPDRSRAYGMIGVTEFGKSAKLRISIEMNNLGRNASESAKVQALSAAILPEVDRVKNAMMVENRDTAWNAGVFDGVKMLDLYDPSYMLKLDFPVFNVSGTEARMIVTQLYDNKVEGVYFLRPGVYLEVEIKLESYSYAASKLADGAEDCYRQTLGNGSEWIIYFANKRDDGTSDYIHSAKVVPTPAGMPGYKKDDVYYVTVHLNGEHILWHQEDLAEDLQAFDEGIVIMNAEDDPYVPVPAAEKPAENKPEEKPADGAWTCAECGAEGNTGKFCPECGSPKPAAPADDGTWTCPNCGTEGNTGKFCPGCGTPKP